MPDFDSARFRAVLGHCPTSVTVVTAVPGGHPRGLTIGTFTSVSLDPPLVGFLPGKESDSWPVMRDTGAFCVNVLAADQGELCWRFAKLETEEKFDGIGWRPAPSGAPILAGALAWVDCAIEDVIDMGDHWFVLGRVAALDHSGGPDPDPLIFFRGKLGHFDLTG